MKTMHLVISASGEYESYVKTPLFVTDDIKKARAYVAKYNRILRALKKHVEGRYLEERDGELAWNDEVSMDRYFAVMDEHECWFHFIEVR